MTSGVPEIGMCFDRTFPAVTVTEFARRLDEGGADRLWMIEDCFYTAAVSLAAASLAVSERLGVGLGILPAVARNPAVTAMEIATLCGLAPDRVVAGIGHGVQDWMGQMGARTASPVTTLDEVITNVKRLLAGERVTFDGQHVHLDDVALDQPPATPPSVLAGVSGPRSLALAGRVADGVVLAEPGSPSFVRHALAAAGRETSADADRPFHVAVFSTMCVLPDRTSAYEAAAPWLGGLIETPTVGLRTLPFFDDLAARYSSRGVAGLVDMPAEWWGAIGPIGTLDDAVAHVHTLAEAGAASVAMFPAPDLDIARHQVDDVIAIVSELSA